MVLGSKTYMELKMITTCHCERSLLTIIIRRLLVYIQLMTHLTRTKTTYLFPFEVRTEGAGLDSSRRAPCSAFSYGVECFHKGSCSHGGF